MNERAAAFGAGPVHVAPLTASATAAVCALARSLGLDTTRIDLFDCRSKGELLERVAAALDFPSTFGGNWDALFDCLADLGWRPATGYVLVFEHAAALRKTEPEVFDTAVAILGDAAAAWQARGLPFRVFVSTSP